jgi:hypothetical protein
MKRFLLLLALAASPVGYCQTAPRADFQSDIFAARSDAVATTYATDGLDALSQRRDEMFRAFVSKTPPAATTSFQGAVGTPLDYNTNPDQRPIGASADWHAHPDMSLTYKWQRSVTFQATLDVNSDRYLSTSSANVDEASLLTKLTFADRYVSSDHWLSYHYYISNKATGDFGTFFSGPMNRIDDIALGIAAPFAFHFPNGHIERSSAGDARLLISTDLSIGRRQASPSKGDGTFTRLQATFSHVVNDSWALGLGPSIKLTWRDAPARRDLLSVTTLVAKWTPAVPAAHDRRLEIDFAATFAHNHSTRDASNFHQLDTGPSVTWALKFP